MLNKKHLLTFLSLYAFVRVFSFFFGPETPLFPANGLNELVTLTIILDVAVLLFKRNPWGWYIIALEIFLGGAGNFLGFSGIALRTWLLVISITIFFEQKLWRHELVSYIRENKKAVAIIAALYVAVGVGAMVGHINDHATKLLFRDVIPYIFLLYYFPLKELLKDSKFISLAENAIVATIIGNTVLTLGTLVAFGTRLVAMQGTYYHWFRDVAGGKITELPFNYFRIVLNEHLLLIPLFAWTTSKVLANDRIRLYGALSLALLGVLATNLTRIYMVALVVVALLLIRQTTFKRWALTMSVLGAGFILVFTTLHFTLSRSKSLGWELFGVRLQSIVAPSTEDSSLSRLLLLPKIIEKIKMHPVIGSGLGDTVTVYSPVFKKTVTTPDYDWGYLELLGELGIIGVVAWTLLLWQVARTSMRGALLPSEQAAFAALLVTNVTSPALFHVLGVILLVYLLSRSLAFAE